MKKNSVVHFEIYADDPDKLVRFYTRLFDWTVEPMPGMNYRLIKTVETDANGRPSQAGGINVVGVRSCNITFYHGRLFLNSSRFFHQTDSHTTD